MPSVYQLKNQADAIAARTTDQNVRHLALIVMQLCDSIDVVEKTARKGRNGAISDQLSRGSSFGEKSSIKKRQISKNARR